MSQENPFFFKDNGLSPKATLSTYTNQNTEYDLMVQIEVKKVNKKCIFDFISRKKISLIKNLASENFPVPSLRKLKGKSFSHVSTTDSCVSVTENYFIGSSSIENEKILENFNFEENRLKNVKFNESDLDKDHDFLSKEICKPVKKILFLEDSTEILSEIATKNCSLKLSMKGPKSGQILKCITNFLIEMREKWTSNNEQEFISMIQIMLDYYSLHESELKNQHSDSIAGCLMLLAGTKIGISVKDFLDALKSQKKTMFSKIKKIKESKSYNSWRKIFHEIFP